MSAERDRMVWEVIKKIIEMRERLHADRERRMAELFDEVRALSKRPCCAGRMHPPRG